MWAQEWILANEKGVEELFGISWEAVQKELMCLRRNPLLFLLLPSCAGPHSRLPPGGGFEGEAASEEERAEGEGPESPRTLRAAMLVLPGQQADFSMRKK